jgi:hypothetical protein
MDIINSKMSFGYYASLVLRVLTGSLFFLGIDKKEKTYYLFCRGRRGIFVLYFPNVPGTRGRIG